VRVILVHGSYATITQINRKMGYSGGINYQVIIENFFKDIVVYRF
jgi:hypothetical protein